MIIVIDGPAGSGKSSTAKALSKRLSLHFLDSGALYRSVTYFWIQKGKPDNDQFFKMLTDIDLEADLTDGNFDVILNGENISDKIRDPKVANHVSDVASLSKVRLFVNRIMREIVKNGTFIADGRDLGTAVFPDADLKFYMDASEEERAERRFNELRAKNSNVTFEEVLENVRRRDHTDQNRTADPLKKADDALLVDTTGKSFEEQVDYMSAIIEDKLNLKH